MNIKNLCFYKLYRLDALRLYISLVDLFFDAYYYIHVSTCMQINIPYFAMLITFCL